MPSRRILRLTVLLLTGLLIVQSVILFAGVRVKRPSGPTLGERFGFLGPVATLSGQPFDFKGYLENSGRCTVLVAVGANCESCRRMRSEWAAATTRWRDSTGVEVQFAWVSVADSVGMADFYRGFEFGDVQRLQVGQDGTTFRTVLGVYVLPTVYLISPSGRLRIGSIGFTLPPVDSVHHICGSA